MKPPTTTLDARFSSPDASPMSWAETVLALESSQLFWITTVRADDAPPLTAVPRSGCLLPVDDHGRGENIEGRVTPRDRLVVAAAEPPTAP